MCVIHDWHGGWGGGGDEGGLGGGEGGFGGGEGKGDGGGGEGIGGDGGGIDGDGGGRGASTAMECVPMTRGPQSEQSVPAGVHTADSGQGTRTRPFCGAWFDLQRGAPNPQPPTAP